MDAKGLTPILNVSDLAESFAWFERLGWRKRWEWGDPPDFGAVGAGACEIFLCRDGQGGRGRSPVTATFGPGGSESEDQGVWMSVWVGDVDEVHRRCLEQEIEVAFPPTDMPWRVREMHVRHPDGHVFRISRGIGYEDEIESFARREREKGPPLPIERVDVPVRLERRLAALLRDLAAHKGLTVGETLEETLLHSFEELGAGVASPHTPRTLRRIRELKEEHGVDYDCHASYRFVEE
ncbi:MAG TPA: bleomycin resistance family protein [Thermoanaerobaculia bacterium]|nr:bleomycin resistance family protein [Thermoanaerobaculia bacterium]